MPRKLSNIDSYINELFAPQSKLQNTISNLADDAEFAMQISPAEGKLIYLLLKCISAKLAIEIGTLNGYSATWIAEALGNEGKLFCFERNKFEIERFQNRLIGHNLQSRIEFIVGNAEQNLKVFDIQVDAIFIDADKASYPIYFDHAQRLLKKGGLLIADNVLLYGNVCGNPIKKITNKAKLAMIEFNKSIANSVSFESVIISTDEGLLVARKCI